MTYGRANFRALARFLPWLCAPGLCCAPEVRAAPRRAPAPEAAGTLLAAGASTWTVQEDDGRVLPVRITAATWFVKGGLPVPERDFLPGEPVRIRLTRAAAGPARALLVCDPETALDLDRRRGHPLSGTILSAGARVWVIGPADGSAPSPVCLSARTAYSAEGRPVPASAFGLGASVTVTTRTLPDGLPEAVSVSDAAPDAGSAPGAEGTPPRRFFLSGTVLEVEAGAGLLAVQDSGGGSQTVATDSRTRIKVRKRPAPLAAVTAGMRVSVRLGAAVDPAGNPIAASMSASD